MKQKALLYLLGMALAVMLYLFVNVNQQKNRELERRIELQRIIETGKRSELEELKRHQDSLINSLWNHVSKLSQEASELNQKLKTYEKRPNVDLDFLAAYDVITKSNYQPQQ